MTGRPRRSTNLYILDVVALFLDGPRTKQEVANVLRIGEMTAGRIVNALAARKMVQPVARGGRSGSTGPWSILFGWVAK